MKKFIVISFLICLHQLAKAQTFQFHMYFEDAIGNKDTLTIGYDIDGTALIDPSFGEEDILGIALDTVFDVRISNALNNQANPTFQTKKQIVADSCSGWWFPELSIEIYSKNWPVTASWDSSLFANDCREGSVFTSMKPGGWWDVGGHASNFNRADFAFTSQVTFTSNHDPSSGINQLYTYVNSSNDTIPVFWMAFGDSSLLKLDLDGIGMDLKAYPNPVVDFLTVEMESDLINEIYIVDLLGRSTLVELSHGHIDLRNFQAGNYVLLVHCNDGKVLKKKLLKE